MHDLLFENQTNLAESELEAYAIELGLDMDTFKRDIGSSEVKDKVESDVMSGEKSGVNGTPTFFINGVRYDGHYDLADLREAVTATAEK